MDQENEQLEIYETIKDNKKLMKKSMIMIISFFSLLFIGVGLFIYLQRNKFFIFNLNRTLESAPDPMVSEIFSWAFYTIIIISLITYVLFALDYLRRRQMSLEMQIDTLKPFQRKYNFADIFSVVPIFLIIVMIINGFFFSFAQVDGASMVPTFCDKDAVIIKYVEAYERESIVIAEQGDKYVIKRLVGLPGDKLVVNATGVYINDERIETFIPYDTQYYDTIIPADSYYVMGDNRTDSTDSRQKGLVNVENMLGTVIYKISASTCSVD